MYLIPVVINHTSFMITPSSIMSLITIFHTLNSSSTRYHLIYQPYIIWNPVVIISVSRLQRGEEERVKRRGWKRKNRKKRKKLPRPFAYSGRPPRQSSIQKTKKRTKNSVPNPRACRCPPPQKRRTPRRSNIQKRQKRQKKYQSLAHVIGVLLPRRETSSK